MPEVVLINPFEVPTERFDTFLGGWDRATEFLRQQPGFLSTRLHQALEPDAHFPFINVARWESEQHFRDAVKEMPAIDDPTIRYYPALYRIVRREDLTRQPGD